MKVPNAEPQMITYSQGCQMTRHVPAHGHEATEHTAKRDHKPDDDRHGCPQVAESPDLSKRFVLVRA